MNIFKVFFMAFLLFSLVFPYIPQNVLPTQISCINTSFSREGTLTVSAGEMHNIIVELLVPQHSKNQEVSLNITDAEEFSDSDGNRWVRIMQPGYEKVFNFNIAGNVSTCANKVYYINETYSFGSEMNKYLSETKHIIINDAIRQEARNITSSHKTDIDRIAALAIWVNDYVKYTIQDVGKNRDSVSVYNDPHGVCTEYTNLFIALSRSLGYPTRAVMGYAYSPDYGWQLHSWAEVYLGEWIGVDPTWLEVGYIDATHIPIYFSEDTEVVEPANTQVTDKDGVLQWKSKEEFGGTSSDITVFGYSLDIPEYSILLAPEDVGIGDEGAIVLNLDSEDYRIMNIMVAPCLSEGLPMMKVKREKFAVLLHPGRNNIIIPYEVSPYLDPRYSYVCPVSIAHSFGSDVVHIAVNSKAGKYTKVFNAFVARHGDRNATVRVDSFYSADITFVDDKGTSTAYVPAGKEVFFDTSFDGISKYVVIYTDGYAQSILLEQSSTNDQHSYILRDFHITSAVPTDRNVTLDISFDVNSDDPYFFKLYVDDKLLYSEKSNDKIYSLNYSFDPGSVGKHKVLAILDTGFDEYKEEVYYSVFKPEITIDKYENETSYVFDVNGPYASYEFYVDGERVDPHVQRNFTAGFHEITVKWVDLAGYERVHTERFYSGEVGNKTVCAAVPILIMLILILFIYKR
ncbi:MAG: transglutaminase-like domain-containing protein [Candidatus Micrarchaeia archaeon]